MEQSGRTNDWESRPPPPPPSSGVRGSALAEIEAASRCQGSGSRSPAPHPSTPPELGLAPWRGSARCRGAGVGGANPAGGWKEAEGSLCAPASPGGWQRLHAPSVRSPGNMSAARAQSGAPGRRARGGRVQWRRPGSR